jgi:ATP-dependent DNA helicase RecG
MNTQELTALRDRVQKNKAISADDNKRLKAAGLVEGRYPNLVVAAEIAAATGQKAKHISYRGFNNQYYSDLIVELIRKHQPVTREDIDKLLLDKLPEVLSKKKKLTKIHNLLQELAMAELIRNDGGRKFSR